MSNSVQLIEVIWTIATVPGLIVWAFNLRAAWLSLRATQELHSDLSTRIYAGVGVRLSVAAISVESIFLLWGLFGMSQPSTTERITPMGLVITVGLVVIALVVAVLGFDIRRADAAVMDLARRANRPEVE